MIYIVIPMDTFTPYEVIRISMRKVFIHLMYKGTDSRMVRVTPVGCNGTCNM